MVARTCAVCSGSMEGRHRSAKRCAKPECRRSGQRERSQRYLKKRGPREPTIMEKSCSRCLRTLLASAFHRNRSKGDGLHVRCKECERRYRETRREQDARNKHVLYLLKRDEILARWHHRLQYCGRTALNERARQYYHANREKIRAQVQDRRARQRALEQDTRARRCACGKAIPPERWFCSVACKAATAKKIVGLDQSLEEASDGAYQPKAAR